LSAAYKPPSHSLANKKRREKRGMRKEEREKRKES
jgi:hypothetical protein